MFLDVNSIVKDFIAVQHTHSSVARGKLVTFCEHREASLLLSIMYNFKGSSIPTPYKGVVSTNTDTWDIILGKFVHFLMTADRSFIPYYKSLPFDWQLIIHIVVARRVLNTVGETAFFNTIQDFYNKNTIVSMVTLPSLVSSDFGVQYLRQKRVTTTTYPMSVYSIPKVVQKGTVKFYINYGTKVVSNTSTKTTKADIQSKIGYGRIGCLFVEHRVQGYKYKKTVTILATGSVEDITALYTGAPYKDATIHMKVVTTVHNDQELVTLFKQNPHKHFLFLSKDGIHSIQVATETITCPCIDYIIDDDYQPKGVVVQYNGSKYNLQFNITNTTLINGIRGRYVKCTVKCIKGEVLSIIYANEVALWHKIYSECVSCGTTHIKHVKDGLCSKCYNQLKQNIRIGEVVGKNYSGNPFTTEFLLDGSHYRVHGNDKLHYECISGQGVLPLGL